MSEAAFRRGLQSDDLGPLLLSQTVGAQPVVGAIVTG
jgi:hypothetical protein